MGHEERNLNLGSNLVQGIMYNMKYRIYISPLSLSLPYLI